METLQPWTQVATPHADIRAGRLDESVFAADLSDVLASRGPLEYRDAETFFRRTYPTQGLVNLLAKVLKRLAGKDAGDNVIQIQTPFGGGKTHSLIALYHLVTAGRDLNTNGTVSEILQTAGLSAVPEAAVVTFVGTAADAVRGKTPWGELAAQLGRYEHLAEHDQRRLAPGKENLRELLSSQPTLILMDEIAEYAVKARDFRGQVVAFYQELTETVKVLPHAVLVVTLPSSAPYGEEGEHALHELQQVFKRVESIETPVEGEEIYEVIRRRLFEDLGSPQHAKRIADAFFDLYQSLGDDLPREVREPAYRDRIRKAYPFHPEIIDILFERWGTFPDFQRTRGVLRLLAHVVSELYNGSHSAPLILPAHINVGNPAVRNEFLRHIGNEYQGVIASDISGQNAKAEQLDRAMGSGYVRFGVASGLARAIFFASFSGSERRGVGVQKLRLAVLQPNMPPPIISDALRRLEEELWFLHVESGTYLFSSQPNLNRVIVEKEEGISPSDVLEQMRRQLEKLAGNELRVTLWPSKSQDVPDTRELKLVLLSGHQPRQAADTAKFVQELFDRCGEPFRTYRNTLVVLAPDSGELATVRQLIRRFLAYSAIKNDTVLWRQLSEENQKNAQTKLKDFDSRIAYHLLSAYRHLAKADEDGIRWLDLGLPTIGADPSLAYRVLDYLRAEEMLLDRLAPQRILDKAFGAAVEEISVGDLYELFLRYPTLPMLKDRSVLINAIVQGVQHGLFGITRGENVVYQAPISLQEIENDWVVTRSGRVHARPSLAAEETDSPLTRTAQRTQPEDGAAESPRSPIKTIPSYRVHVSIPCDKLSEFFRGVVSPLKTEGADVNIEIILSARSAKGIRRTTLEHTVRETLLQIGAIVKEESVE